MTFSDKKLSRRLRRDYHLVWENIEGDDAAGSSFAHDPTDPAGQCPRGAGDHNVQILVLDEWGRLLNATAGYIDADDLIEELDLAEELHREIRGQKKKATAARIVKKRHQEEERRDRDAQASRKDVFAALTRMRRTQDHRYCARHPLQSYRDFTTAGMVGNGSSFFGTTQGQVPKERIGDLGGADNLDEKTRELLDRLTGGEDRKRDSETKKKKSRRRPSSRPTSRPSGRKF